MNDNLDSIKNELSAQNNRLLSIELAIKKIELEVESASEARAEIARHRWTAITAIGTALISGIVALFQTIHFANESSVQDEIQKLELEQLKETKRNRIDELNQKIDNLQPSPKSP